MRQRFRDHFSEMAELLPAIKARSGLSINDRSEVRVLFAGFAIDPVGVTYTVGGRGNAQAAREMIISN